MKIKYDTPSIICVLLLTVFATVLPFANTCEDESSRVCTWNAQNQGNGEGRSFTDFYSFTIYHF